MIARIATTPFATRRNVPEGAAPRPAFALAISLLLAGLLLSLALAAGAIIAARESEARAALGRDLNRLRLDAAIRIALGELQTAVGPDRRVTANAAILDDGLAQKPVANPLRCGVWRTSGLRSEPASAPPFLHRDPDGALADARFGADPSRRYDRAAEVLRWLVSGDPSRIGSEPPLPLKGDLSAPPENFPDGTRFAWAASDNSQKTCIRTTDTRLVPGETAPRAEGTALALLPGWIGDGRPPALPKTATPDDLVARGLLAPDAPDGLRNDIARESVAILADPLRGGLRRDLTPFLLSGKSGDITERTPLLDDGSPENPFRRHGPSFGLLRRWTELRDEAESAGRITPGDGDRFSDPPGTPSALFHDGTHADLPDVAAPTRHPVGPVVAEAAVYRRLSYDPSRRGSNNAPLLRLHLHPRVVLWNPYSEPLAAARYLVHLRAGGSPVFKLVRTGRNLTGAISGWRVYDNALVNYATTQGSLLFVLDCPELPAGESRLFLPPASAPLYGKTPSVKTYDAAANRLVPVAAATNASLWLEDTDAFEDAGLRALAGANLAGESWRIENSAAEDFAIGLKRLPPGPAMDWKTLRVAPTLRYVSHSVKCGSGTTPAPAWPPGASEPLGAEKDAPPPRRSREGVRLRRFRETAANRAAYPGSDHMESAPLGDHDPAAVFSCPHPFDNATPAATSGDRRAEQFGVFARDEADPASDADAFAPSHGVTAHPFGLPSEFSGQRAVVALTLPPKAAEIISLADFSDARLSPWAWHPAHHIGESAITPVTPPQATAHPKARESFAALGPGGPKLTRWVREGEAPEARRVFDLRFETNHALWDRLVPLSGDEPQRRAFATDPVSFRLPCADLIPEPGEDLSRILSPDADKSAPSVLALDRAFNVNSVSVTAWEQWLAENRGLGPRGDAKGGEPGLTSFARDTKGAATSAETAPDHADFAAGGRRLTDAELHRLAERIVEEVKRRGPFLSVSDFVNRRLSPETPDTSPDHPSPNACGALQAAIHKAQINPVTVAHALPHGDALPGSGFLGRQRSPGRHDGARSVLSQADLLRAGGHRLVARGDTFALHVVVIGESGSRLAAEVTVRRTPAPLHPDPDDPINPELRHHPDFGRRLIVTRVIPQE